MGGGGEGMGGAVRVWGGREGMGGAVRGVGGEMLVFGLNVVCALRVAQ